MNRTELKHRCRCLLLFVLTLLPSVSGAEPVPFRWTGFFARDLSDYGLFRDIQGQIPSDGLHPYDIITPLFSDYAYKRRFVLLPPGESMEYSPLGVFDLPVGSVLVKTFLYPHDFRVPEQGHRLVETRLLVHTKDKGWQGAAYVWNDEQTEATLAITGKRLPVQWKHYDGTVRQTQYTVPNMIQCRHCHAGLGATHPLSLTARQLNHDYISLQGKTENLLAAWTRLGILRGALRPEDAPRVADWDDPSSGTIFDRVRGYFDTNCSHCHNPQGLASLKRIDLRYSQSDEWKRGVNMRSTGGHFAESGLEKVIVPGHPDRSSVYLRMKATDFTFMMPQIGRSVVHDEGLQLVGEWIRSLPHGE